MKANNFYHCFTATFRRYISLTHKFPSSCYFLHVVGKTKSPYFSMPLMNARSIVATNPSLTQWKRDIDLPKSSSNMSQESGVWTIPNILCGIRIIAAPVLGYSVIDHHYMLSIGVLSVAGLTDLADGYIARNFKGQSSKLGTFLDPLADKILIVTLYCSMVYVHLVPVLLVALIVFRDVLLLLAGMYIRYISLPPPRNVRKYFDSSSSRAELRPTYISKVNTVLQIIVAAVSLYAPTTTWITRDILSVMWYTAGTSTIISGLSYMFSKNTFVISKDSSKKSH